MQTPNHSSSAISQIPAASANSSAKNPSDLIKSGLGNLSLAELFKFSTTTQIAAELQKIAGSPRTYGVPGKYIDGTPQFSQSRGNQFEPLQVATNQAHTSGSPLSFNTNGKSSIRQVVGYILRHIGQGGVHKIFIPPSSDEEDVYLGYGDTWQLGQTVYDALGWVLSVTAFPEAGHSPSDLERIFYLPLLAVYGKWCRILTFPSGPPTERTKATQDLSSAKIEALKAEKTDPEIKAIISANRTSLHEDDVDAPSMFAISRFTDISKSNIVMLGATPGAYRFRSYDTVRERQARLMERGFIPNVPDGLAFKDKEGAEGTNDNSVNYGTCAETSFYLYGRVPRSPRTVFHDESELLDAVRSGRIEFQRVVQQQSTRGMALKPFGDGVSLQKMESYSESQLITKLQNPCPSCQGLISQLGWDWKTTHDITALRNAIKIQNGRQAASSSTNQSTSAQNKQAKIKGRGSTAQTPQATGSASGSSSSAIPKVQAQNVRPADVPPASRSPVNPPQPATSRKSNTPPSQSSAVKPIAHHQQR